MTAPTPNPASPGSSSGVLTLTREQQGDVVVVRVRGMAVAEMAGQLSRALQEAAQLQPKVMAVDLSELGFISSTGLGSIVAAHVSCQKYGTRLFLINPRPMIAEVLRVTRLNNLFKVCATVAEAEQLVAGGAK
ncbi:MAG: hypothetical protein HJJLKODD_00902 [Phycisphaerae bacterium]|nr:hypothetical protein [Phycisphaerae bacterium]